MARGMEGVRGVAADIEARKNAGGGGQNWFRLPNSGDSATVRFLEQEEDVSWAMFHELPAKPGRMFGDKVACRDQDEQGMRIGEACPGCEKEYPRKFQGMINLIWRNAPVWKKDANGRLEKDQRGNLQKVGEEDQIAVWRAGITVFEELDGKDATYKGLTSRDFKVTRRGTGLNTTYSIEPADPDGGPQPLSKADEKLAAEKYDFTDEITPQSLESWGNKDSFGQQTSEEIKPAEQSPFMRRRG